MMMSEHWRDFGMKIDDLINEPEQVEWDDEVGFEIIREDEYGQRI